MLHCNQTAEKELTGITAYIYDACEYMTFGYSGQLLTFIAYITLMIAIYKYVCVDEEVYFGTDDRYVIRASGL
jgi:hypothetical protein